MNFFRLYALLLGLILLPTSAYSLSIQEKQFAVDETFSGTTYSPWYELKHYNYADFTVLSSVGDGTIQVQYASDSAKASVIDDASVGAFLAGTPASLYGSGLSKFYIRLKLVCSSGSCTYKGWFTAKGMMP